MQPSEGHEKQLTRRSQDPLLTTGTLTPRIDHPGKATTGRTGQGAIGSARGGSAQDLNREEKNFGAAILDFRLRD
jgi:hypothetical protein